MELTQDQKRVLEAWDKNGILIAAAGSGKTSVLVEKYLMILDKSASTMANILAVTFTEKAAAELKARIGKRLGLSPEALEEAPIQTLHGFYAKVLEEETGKAPKIIDQHFTTALRARVIHETLLNLISQNNPDAVTLVDEFGFKNTKDILFSAFDKSFQIRDWQVSRRDLPFEDHLTTPLLKLFEKMRAAYQTEKQKEDLVDFDDLEENTLRLLSENETVRHKYQERYHMIMVDEFQDTNPTQVRLIELLHDPKKNCFFAVGDPKQSIYQFRGADVSLFHHMVGKIKNQNGEVLFLRDNFRSDPDLIEPINGLFEPLLPKQDFQPMTARKEKSKDGLGIKVLDLPEFQYAEERRQKEAELMAREIKILREQGRAYRDMVCLFRTRTAIPLVEKVFADAQIPSHAVSRGPLFEAQEVLDLINLLKTLTDPKDSLSLVGVLRSPLFSCSDEDLFLHFYAGEKERLREEKARIDHIRQAMKGKTLSAALLQLFEDPHFEKLYRTPQELANLERILSLAESFESLGVKTIKQFLETVQGLRDAGTRISEASLFAPSANCVRLMTIHAAKGLEFPIVFLTDLNYRTTGDKRFFLFDPQKGIGLKYLSDESEGLRDHFEKSPLFEQIEDENKKNQKQESYRLLYVAMTRAKEGLYLPLTRLEGKKKTGNWNEILADYFLTETEK